MAQEYTYSEKMQAQMMGIWAHANGTLPADSGRTITQQAYDIASTMGLDDEMTRHFTSGFIQAALKM